jgi:hypothetical protein
MTTAADLRLLLPDPIQFDRVTDIGDGAMTDFELANAPVTLGSVKVYKNGVLQTLTTHYTLDESLGLVTFVTAPAANDAVVATYTFAVLSDAQLALCISTQSDDVRLSLAMALDVIGSSEALIQKRIRVLDLSTDGPAVAAELRARAKALREEAALALGTTEDELPFAIAEQVYDDFSARERAIKQAQRGAI